MQGQVGADTLSITDSPIVVTNQTLGLTTTSTLDFTRASCDGIFVSPHSYTDVITLAHIFNPVDEVQQHVGYKSVCSNTVHRSGREASPKTMLQALPATREVPAVIGLL